MNSDPSQSETPVIKADDPSSPFVSGEARPFDPADINRPAPVLLKYYIIVSIFGGPFFPIVFLPLYFKYITLRYKFDESGVSMSWGILFRREIHLTYRRIQDIHLNRNVIQRWLGLATVGIQTASASSTPEMSIEGILEASALRDHLYAEMRGARGETVHPPKTNANGATTSQASADEVTQLLREILSGMQGMSDRLEALSQTGAPHSDNAGEQN